jgi:O-antigen/teichoic acid export membrane protein
VADVDTDKTGDSPYVRATRLVGTATSLRIAATAVTATAGLATTILAVRLLGPARYGTLAFALSLVGLATGASRLGLGSSTVRTVAAHLDDEKEVLARTIRGTFTVLAATCLVAATVIAVVLSTTNASAAPLQRMVLIASLAIFLIGRNLATANFWIAAGLGRPSAMELGNLTIALVQVAALSGIAMLNRGSLILVVGAYAIAGVVGSAVSFLSLRRLTRQFSNALRISARAGRETLRIAAPYAMSGVTVLIIGQFDVFVLGLTGTRAEVGVYEPTLRIAERLLNIVPLLFITGFVPAATRLLGRNRREDFRLLYRTVSTTAFVIATPAVILLAVFPELTLKTLFGETFAADRVVAWLLLAGYATNLVFGLNGGALAATGQRRAIVVSYGVALAVMALTAVALIPPLGPLGAATATAVSYVVLNAAVSVALYRLTGAHMFAFPAFGVVLSSIIPIGGVALFRQEVSAFPTAVLLAVGAWCIWVLLLFLLRWLRWSDVAVLLPRRRHPSVDDR